MAAGLEMDAVGAYPGRHRESVRRRGVLSQHLHRAFYPAFLAALEWSVLGGWCGRDLDRRFASVVLKRDGDCALHRHLPDPLAVLDFEFLRGHCGTLASRTTQLSCPVL